MEAKFMAAEEKLEVGDIVKLKSGGPDMTVIDCSIVVSCMWFDKSCRLHEEDFLKVTLKKV